MRTGNLLEKGGSVQLEIPSAPLRAGSSLRLKNGYAQDDAGRVLLPFAQNSEKLFAAHHVAVFEEVHHRLQSRAGVRNLW